ncbi:MAG: ACP S-malonyltransferase, partial [Acidobacteria bacterium]|nr:ACP S-malonyltransferase [Acidobacteriota bacterium]
AQGEVFSVANWNSPEQIVIAGHTGAVKRAVELATAAGARRAVLLPVSAAFHCALMQPARDRLAADLAATPFSDLRWPLVNNFAAEEIRSGAAARQGLIDQVSNPVRWTESVRLLARLGVSRFLEVGPGSVLSGLLRAILPNTRAGRFGEAADLAKVTSSER